MPELPEVEHYRLYLQESALNQKIVSVETENEGRMLKVPLAEIRDGSVGESFTDTDRIGKYLFLKSSGGKWLMWHFGLTGQPVYYHGSSPPPKYQRILFRFDNGYQLAFACLRKFGRLDLADDVESYRIKNKIGQDAMHIPVADFVQALSKKRIAIKTALLQQKKFAGVGNWIADEMLFQTSLHPETPSNAHSPEQLAALHESMQEIIATAITEGGKQNFPDHYLVKVRKDGESCPTCETELTRLVVGGRGTYICDRCQPGT
ncbi:MAG: DNA-formamidopyrimidine glycosylase family protein [Bacteroidota bacterium]